MPKKRRSLIDRDRRRVRRKAAAPDDEPLEALEWDGVDWTGEVDEDGTEIGLIDDEWDLPADLEVVENTLDHEARFEAQDRTDAEVWDEDLPSSGGIAVGEWDEDPLSEEGSFDAFKALVESEQGAPLRKSTPRPESTGNTGKVIAVAAVILMLFGVVAITVFGAAGLGALVVTSTPNDAMVVIEEPVPLPAAVAVDLQPTFEEVPLEDPPEEPATPPGRPAVPASVDEEPVPEPDTEPITEQPEIVPEPEPVIVAPPVEKKRRRKKGKK